MDPQFVTGFNQPRRHKLSWLIAGIVTITVLMVGMVTTQVFAAEDVRVRAAHLAPFASSDTNVDIFVTTYGILNKAYGQSSKYIDRGGDGAVVRVELTADGSFVLSDTIIYEDSTDYTLLVVGDNTNQPIQLVQLTDNTDAPAAGNFKLRLGHYAPFAADLADTAADIRYDNGDLILGDVEFGDVSDFIELAEGTYDLQVTTPGGGTTLIDFEPITFDAGEVVSVYAVGNGTDQDLGGWLYAAEGFGDFIDLEVAEPPPAPSCELLSSTGTFFQFEYANIPDGSMVTLNGDDLFAVSGSGEFDDSPSGFEDGAELTYAIMNNGETVASCGTVTFNIPPVTGARLYVAHLAAFAAGDGSSVTVRLNGSDSLSEVVYGDSSGYLSVPAGDYLVEVVPTGTETVAISATVTLTDGVDYTAIAIGDGANQALSLKALVDDNSAPAAGNFALRLGHLAPFADTLAGTTADIRLQDGTPILQNIDFDTVVPRIELPAGTYDLKITSPGGAATLIDPLPVTFDDGDIVSAFASGDGSNQELGIFAIVNGAVGSFLPLTPPGPSDDEARLYVAHLAPFADEETGTSVTVRLNGTDALTDFSYGDSTGYIVVPAGDYLVEVVPTGSETVAMSANVTLEPETDYTAIATGDGSNQALAILAVQDDNSDTQDRFGKIRFGHVAPFTSESVDTRVDVRVEDGSPKGSVIARNVRYGELSEYLTLAAGSYDLVVTIPGGSAVVLDPPPFTLADDEVLTLLVTGDGTNEDFNIFAISNGNVGQFIVSPNPISGGRQIFLPVISN